jgi:hypothetical protein
LYELVALANALAYTFIDDFDNYAPKAGVPFKQFQGYIAQAKTHQKDRLSLPPFPAFPQGPISGE